MMEKMIEEMKALRINYFGFAVSNTVAKKYDRANEMLDNCIEIAEKHKEQEPRWIPVEERLPKEDERYLCVSKFCNNYVRDIFFFTKDAYEIDKHDFEQYKGKNKALFYTYDYEYGYCERYGVIAWMPLPEYKEGDVE